jgi:hypothetical protein
MTLHEYPDVEQRSEEWSAQRRGIVTASVVGQLITTRRLTAIDYDCPKCGATADGECLSLRDPSKTITTLHPERTTHAKRQPSPLIIEPASNDTSRDLTMLLVSERITGWTEPTFMSEDMFRGQLDEPLAREKYDEHYAPVTTTGFMVEDRFGFKIGFSPDGLVGNDGLLEIKSRRPKTQVKTVLANGVPAENMAQLQCALLVSGRQWIDYVSYAGGMALWRKRVLPSPDWFRAIVAAVKQFENNAAEMMRVYAEDTDGLPMTERRIEEEMVV